MLGILLAFQLQAQPAKAVAAYGYFFPKASFRDLLEITAKIAHKQVIVSSEDELKINTSLVLAEPISRENARKVIGALLLLEGYELVEEGAELHLRQILTKEQCDAMNKALGRPRQEPEVRLPRQRVAAGEKPKEWIVIRPEQNKTETAQPGADKPANPAKDDDARPVWTVDEVCENTRAFKIDGITVCARGWLYASGENDYALYNASWDPFEPSSSKNIPCLLLRFKEGVRPLFRDNGTYFTVKGVITPRYLSDKIHDVLLTNATIPSPGSGPSMSVEPRFTKPQHNTPEPTPTKDKNEPPAKDQPSTPVPKDGSR